MSTPVDITADLDSIATRTRQTVIELGHAAGPGGAHFGPALSLVEVMTALYSVADVHPERVQDPDRDRIILSKGHGSLALYAVLHEFGYIPEDVLRTAEQDGSRLPGQPIRDRELGIEFSSGSLGMGLGYGIGLALSARKRGRPRHVYVVMGDGELNEGSVWEAAMAAAHYGLDNVTAVIDANGMQSDGPTSDVMSLDPAQAWTGFRWDVREVDGHSIAELRDALTGARSGAPRCIIAHTTKGRGVSFMDGVVSWHHGRMTQSQYEQALHELASEATR